MNDTREELDGGEPVRDHRTRLASDDEVARYRRDHGHVEDPLTIYMNQVDTVLAEVRRELLRALTKHPPTTPGWCPHGGYAIIREELEKELWEHVCADTGRSPEAGKEAVQVAAMGVRYVVECVGIGHLVNK